MIDWIRSIALVSVVIYFIWDYFDGRRIFDEREELIRLKSLEFAHKASLLVLAALAGAYLFLPGLGVAYVILAQIAAALYGEILAKVYYRWRL